MRTGAEYLASLNDGRTVYLDGAVVENVAEHPAFAPVARTVAGLYDYAADPSNQMQYHAEEIGGPANLVYSIPRSPEQLAARGQAIARWAQQTKGWLGRSPDHLGATFAGFASNAGVFEVPGRGFDENVRSFYRHILKNSSYVSYAVIPPQYSRASTASSWGRGLHPGRRGARDRRGTDRPRLPDARHRRTIGR